VNGTPSHDHLGDIFATLDARPSSVASSPGGGADQHARRGHAVDGKTSRRSYQKKGSKEAIPHRSPPSRRGNASCEPGEGEREVERDCSHPRAARHDVDRGAVVTIDAMGCQRDIGRENYREKSRLHSRAEGQSDNPARDVEVFVAEQKALKYKDTTISTHGNVRRRSRPDRDPKLHRDPRCRLAAGAPPWPGSTPLSWSKQPARNQRQDHHETRSTSPPRASGHLVAPWIRAHWAIGNSLHWVMDMVFRDDECRVERPRPANFATCPTHRL